MKRREFLAAVASAPAAVSLARGRDDKNMATLQVEIYDAATGEVRRVVTLEDPRPGFCRHFNALYEGYGELRARPIEEAEGASR